MVTRRVLLQAGGTLGASVGLASFAVAQPGDGRIAYRFFTPEEAAFIEAAVDRLIPPEPDWPGAREAGVPNYIDLQLAGSFGQGDHMFLGGPSKPGTPSQGYQLGLSPAQVYRTSLTAILERTGAAGAAFADASPQEQDDRTLEIARIMGGKIVSPAYMETPYSIVPYQTTHNSGGAVMGSDPTTSAVNRYLQSWDVPNVFVQGASAFPKTPVTPDGHRRCARLLVGKGDPGAVFAKPRPARPMTVCRRVAARVLAHGHSPAGLSGKAGSSRRSALPHFGGSRRYCRVPGKAPGGRE